MTSKMLHQNVFIFFTILLKAAEIQAQCVRPSPGENRILDNSDILLDTFPSGTTVTFKCATGYTPVNPSVSRKITCSGNQWTSLQLECEKKTCGSLGDIPDGKYVFDNGREFGSTVTAECNPGYILTGPKIRTCMDQGWDGRHPTCEAVKCINPPSVTNGDLDEAPQDIYEYQHSITYRCNKDYTLFGQATLSCSESGTFQPEPPRCTKVSCPAPDVINGIRRGGGRPPYKYQDYIEYKCETGYQMKGQSHIVCKENVWEPAPPTCERTAVVCNEPDVPNAIRSGSTPPYEYLQFLKYECKTGFQIKGESKIVCKENGWEPPPPKCEQIAVVETTTPSTAKPTEPEDKTDGDSRNKGNGLAIGLVTGGIVVAVAAFSSLGYYIYKKKASTRGYSGKVATNNDDGEL